MAGSNTRAARANQNMVGILAAVAVATMAHGPPLKLADVDTIVVPAVPK
jgi:hypothetical protein